LKKIHCIAENITRFKRRKRVRGKSLFIFGADSHHQRVGCSNPTKGLFKKAVAGGRDSKNVTTAKGEEGERGGSTWGSVLREHGRSSEEV